MPAAVIARRPGRLLIAIAITVFLFLLLENIQSSPEKEEAESTLLESEKLKRFAESTVQLVPVRLNTKS